MLPVFYARRAGNDPEDGPSRVQYYIIAPLPVLYSCTVLHVP